MKVVENSPQNPRNCTILKKFLGGGACPQTPLAKARSFAARDMPLRSMYIQNPRNFKDGQELFLSDLGICMSQSWGGSGACPPEKIF